jgi:hypothetical protein
MRPIFTGSSEVSAAVPPATALPVSASVPAGVESELESASESLPHAAATSDNAATHAPIRRLLELRNIAFPFDHGSAPVGDLNRTVVVNDDRMQVFSWP